MERIMIGQTGDKSKYRRKKGHDYPTTYFTDNVSKRYNHKQQQFL